MKFFILTFILLPSLALGKSDFELLNNCLKELVDANSNTPFHYSTSSTPKIFYGELNKTDGVFFNDFAGNFYFISKSMASSPKNVYISKREVYSVKLDNRKILVKQLKNEKAQSIQPLIVKPINEDKNFKMPLIKLISRHGVYLLKNLKNKVKNKKSLSAFDLDGLREYKVLSVCSIASKRSNNPALSKIIDSLKNKLANQSDIKKANVLKK